MVITRFAPSPTGDLHLGSVRTALYSWLFARHTQGKFRLRIEDTDLQRSTEAAVQVIFEGMQWLGLDWDEEVVFQTGRFSHYIQIIERLITEGHAYRCYCSTERLETLRAEQTATQQKPRYDGHCRDLQHGDTSVPHTVRFRQPQSGAVSFDDIVHGTIIFQNEELDDLVILRSDGSPTYNLTVVVDDAEMGITHAIRGDDHINNTPRQINIFRALGKTPPQYAHIPMILGTDGKRLSKRHGAMSVLQFQEEGFLPEAMINYLVRLGWASGDQEIFSREELIRDFTLEKVNKSPAAFDREKLLWLNQHYIKTLPAAQIVQYWLPRLAAHGVDTEHGPNLEDVVDAQRERVKTLEELTLKSRYFFEPVVYDAAAVTKHLTPEARLVLAWLHAELATCEWESTALHALLQAASAHFQVNLGQVAQPVRVALTGNTVSPPIDKTMYLLGRAEVCQRIAAALVV